MFATTRPDLPVRACYNRVHLRYNAHNGTRTQRVALAREPHCAIAVLFAADRQNESQEREPESDEFGPWVACQTRFTSETISREICRSPFRDQNDCAGRDRVVPRRSDPRSSRRFSRRRYARGYSAPMLWRIGDDFLYEPRV